MRREIRSKLGQMRRTSFTLRFTLTGAVFLLGGENFAGVSVEEDFATFEVSRRIARQWRTVEVELAYFVEPASELLQILIVFFQFAIGEMLGAGLLGDFRLEIGAAANELLIPFVAVMVEPLNHLFLLTLVEPDSFQKDRLGALLAELDR